MAVCDNLGDLMKPLFAALVFFSVPAFAQSPAEAFFGNGKPYVFTEAPLDRRFQKTRMYQELLEGPSSDACGSVLGGLLTALAETGPALHKRDENFYLDPMLASALDLQMTLPRFPARAFLVTMVRRVMIDKRMPAAWLTRAEELKLPLLALAKLKYLADGVRPIDSFYLTLPAFQARYEEEVARANSSAARTALLEFRDRYFDRDVAWAGLTLMDVGVRKGFEVDDRDDDVARLVFDPENKSKPRDPLELLEPKKNVQPLRVTAKLSSQQYVQLSRLPKQSKVWVRGRIHDVAKGFTHVELRDALIFEDRDWQGLPLLPAGAVARCPAAVNDLTGVASVQPGGFGRR